MFFRYFISYSLVVFFSVMIAIGFEGCAKKQVKEDRDIQEGELGVGGRVGPVEIGYSGKMNIVHFDYDAYGLTQEAREVLKNNVGWLKQNKNISVQIEGHCDNRGTEGYNLALGQKRAETVRNYFVDLGVSPNRLTTISYGEEKPADPAETEEGWSKNRRAEFVITDK